MNDRISYRELREMAIVSGVNDNIRAIGKWIKDLGYKKHHGLTKDRKSFYYYTID
jgi:hypothetical protein